MKSLHNFEKRGKVLKTTGMRRSDRNLSDGFLCFSAHHLPSINQSKQSNPALKDQHIGER